ncbi:MAG: hypothetical protein AAF628_33425 [Planctomycetota bacterium]
MTRRPNHAAGALEVHLKRLSNTHHRMDWARPDGTTGSATLETRSCLLHDLVHFAVETEAGLTDSLYGRLARGGDYTALAAPPPAEWATSTDELVITETVVGPLQGAWRRGLDPVRFVAELRRHRDQVGAACPAWLDVDLVARVQERLRQLEGQWRGTPFGEALTLRFPV